jgi:hypothetical protein
VWAGRAAVLLVVVLYRRVVLPLLHSQYLNLI